MNKKLFVFILVVLFVFAKVSAQTNAGYELALTAFSASADNVQQNQLFTVTATPRNVGSEQFPGGQVGAALVDNNGRITAVIGSANRSALNARATGGALTINSFVPETVRAGQYQLMAVVRPANGEWRVVTQTLQNVSSAINLTVTAERGIAGGGYGMALTVFTASASGIQHYESFSVTATPRNVGAEQFPGGQVGAALVDNNGRIAAVIGTRNRGTLNAGSLSGALEFICTVPHTVNPGRYQLRAVIRPNGGEWRLATLSLPDIPNSINFEVRVNPNIVVAPLLQTKWSQSAPYNSMLPGGSGNLVPGCDVIVAAQIMKFYRHPMRTSGQSESYTMRTSRLNVPSVNLNAVFNWDDMLNSYHSDGSDSNDRQRNAVAQLILHIGVLRKKDFTTGYTGDGAAGYPQLLTTIYGFDKSIQYLSRGNYSDADWENIIRSQLDAGMPVFYSGNNETNTTPHTFIIDGYDNQGRFHINMGWGGLHDGWYFLNAINPGNSDFNFYQNIYINIKPDEGSIGSNEFMLSAFTASSASVSQNEVLTVTPVLNSQGFFPGGQAGIALVGNNNNITAVIGSRNMGSNWQPGSRAALVINCSVPGTVNPGQYRLMAVTRIEGGEWKIVTASDREARVPNSIPFSVTKGAANSGGYVLAFASINADNGIVSASRGAQFNVNYNIRNPGTESFEGSLRAVLIDNAGNETVIGTRASTSFDAGSGRTSFVSCTIPNTIAHGNYQLKIAVRPTDGEWRIITMSFDNAPNSISFTVR